MTGFKFWHLHSCYIFSMGEFPLKKVNCCSDPGSLISAIVFLLASSRVRDICIGGSSRLHNVRNVSECQDEKRNINIAHVAVLAGDIFHLQEMIASAWLDWIVLMGPLSHQSFIILSFSEKNTASYDWVKIQNWDPIAVKFFRNTAIIADVPTYAG